MWYSRVNDNFHDFFTEYVPFGEQAVLYLEEMDFRKRFPGISERVGSKQRDTGANVKIPAQSGASWRVADSGEPASRQSSALSKAAPPPPPPPPPPAKEEPNTPVIAAKKEELKEPPKAAEPQPVKALETAPKRIAGADSDAAPETAAGAELGKSVTFKAPEVNEPSRWPPASPIDLFKLKDANDPCHPGPCAHAKRHH